MIVAIAIDTFCDSTDGSLKLRDGAKEFFELATARNVKLLVLVDVGTAKGKGSTQTLKFWKTRLTGLIPEAVKKISFIGYRTGELASQIKGNNIYLCVVGNRTDIEQVRGMVRTLIYDNEENHIPEFRAYERAYNMWGVTETLRSMFRKVDRENIRNKRMKRELRKAGNPRQ